MKVEFKNQVTDSQGTIGNHWMFILYDDNDNYLCESLPIFSEAGVVEACRKYFPQFRLDGEEKPNSQT